MSANPDRDPDWGERILLGMALAAAFGLGAWIF